VPLLCRGGSTSRGNVVGARQSGGSAPGRVARLRGTPRAGSAAARTVDHLPTQTILSAGTLRAVIGPSHQRASDGLARLAESGVLRQIGGGMYDRTYAADELFTLIEASERLVAHRTTIGLGC
jgi:hypothetical protein